jgi:hypothetical protein
VPHFRSLEIEPSKIIPVIAQFTGYRIGKIGIISIRVFVNDGRIGSEHMVPIDVGLEECLPTSLDLFIEASDVV